MHILIYFAIQNHAFYSYLDGLHVFKVEVRNRQGFAFPHPPV